MSSRSHPSRETNEPSDSATPSSPPPRKRGRKRILPKMSNRERARYYRLKEAAARAESQAAIQALHDQVDLMELQEHIHRQVICDTISASTRAKIVRLLTDFLNNQVNTLHTALHEVHHRLECIQIVGDASAPIIRLDCSLQGRLLPSIVHQIYPHIIGNTVLLDRLMHEDMEYACRCWFYFSPDGTLDYHVVEMDGVGALHQALGSLQTVGHIIADIGGL
ncbi:hypothetical protein Poli38472_006979 [Pythium oligandrum]|uniref:Uncharacterized protein n=1 Tax=Pythium oligandrum TaxID=41045 RepID=A0A8K1C9A7_PYTOL|nr:hypothetical protein Poli38472_006979 [Pythium oligandrum]|eukprot:TMW58834.1 hypothetical protein Poli38472_006979 [Pythium oligandrum]